MKAQVIISNIFIGKTKYRRGDIVEVDDIDSFGTKLAPYVEQEKPKKKIAKKKVKSAKDKRRDTLRQSAGQADSQEDVRQQPGTGESEGNPEDGGEQIRFGL